MDGKKKELTDEEIISKMKARGYALVWKTKSTHGNRVKAAKLRKALSFKEGKQRDVRVRTGDKSVMVFTK